MFQSAIRAPSSTRLASLVYGFPEGLAAFLCLGFPPNKKTTRQRIKTRQRLRQRDKENRFASLKHRPEL